MTTETEKTRTSEEIPTAKEVADSQAPVLPVVNPAIAKTEAPKSTFHPAVYVICWITLSSAVILFNKELLDQKKSLFPFRMSSLESITCNPPSVALPAVPQTNILITLTAIILTTWHLSFATFMTQVLARTTTLLDGRKKVKMTGRVYLRAIVPIGFFFSLSLIGGNKAYLYLSVAFIQMLKATTPVAVLLTTWGLGMSPPNMKILFNVSFIVIGVVIASFGEVRFVLTGFIYQIGGITFEAIRLVMVQRLLSSTEFKMDPLVSLYYFAPVCAIMNGIVALIVEVPGLSMENFYRAGFITLLANAMVAFLLNVSVVFLIGKTSSLVLTLCGVLKDILLVTVSAMVHKDPVTPLQLFGYSIALGGLIYYKLGMEKLREYAGHANRSWAEYGATNPIRRRLLVIGVSAAILVGIVVFLGYSTNLPTPSSVNHLLTGKLPNSKA